jgi:vancomycin resistance protein VanW
MHLLPTPKHRNSLRRFLGKEFYILKRRWQWLSASKRWSGTVGSPERFPFEVKSHRSVVLRELAGVDMRLQENKRTNLRLAIRHLNGIVIAPGETFSLWKLVGRPTAAKGYLEGLVLQNGTIQTGIGGGLCQLGNLLFWLFAHSPLTITERYRHGYDVFPDVNRNVPFGAGATLSYNYIDLQVKNETDQPFLLGLWLDETCLNGVLRAAEEQGAVYRIEERDHCMNQQFWGGYTRHNRIVQICTLPDGTETEKLLVENHAIMRYAPFLEMENGKGKMEKR